MPKGSIGRLDGSIVDREPIYNCPLKGIGVKDIIIIFSIFWGVREVFHWMRIEISSGSCVFRGRGLRFGADS